jgi:hypothetical protein
MFTYVDVNVNEAPDSDEPSLNTSPFFFDAERLRFPLKLFLQNLLRNKDVTKRERERTRMWH